METLATDALVPSRPRSTAAQAALSSAFGVEEPSPISGRGGGVGPVLRGKAWLALAAFLAGCVLGALGSAQADAAVASPWTEAVFIPATGGSVTAEQLLAMPGVQSASGVFNESERAYLARAGEVAIAGSIRVRLTDAKALAELQAQLRAGGAGLPAGRLELNPTVTLHAANPEQWALDNRGEPQEVLITDIQSKFIHSVAGEDVGVRTAPAEVPGRKPLVAVIDTGVETTHPALASRLHRTAGECRALEGFKECMRTQADKGPCHKKYDKLDVDGNGYPLDCSGWDATGELSQRTGIAGSNEMSDRVGHGTHVAGIIAGTGFISGIASEVEILPIKVLAGSNSVNDAAEPPLGPVPAPTAPEFGTSTVVADIVARGVLYAIRSGAQVLNLSLGYSIHDDSELMRRMVALAQSRGILVVAAAGNESSRTPVYPCRYAGVICVAAFSADGSISHFSDYGDSVDVAAPGYKILSSWESKGWPRGGFTERKGYDFKSGTSMASPYVAGALARLLNLGYSSQEAYARMILGTRPTREPTAMPELARKFTLSGNLDLGAASRVAPQPLILPELKEPVLAGIDRAKSGNPKGASFKLSLKNYWRDAARVDVQVAVSSDSPVARKLIRFGAGSAALDRSFTAWKSGETRLIEGALSWDASLDELPGDFYLEVTIRGAGSTQRSFKKALTFVVPVRPLAGTASADAKIARIETDLTAKSLPGNYAMKPITCLPDRSFNAAGPDLLLILRPNAKTTILQALGMSGQGGARRLDKRGGFLLDASKEQLFTISCLDYDRDGSRNYVVASVSSAPGADGQGSKEIKKFTLTHLDSQFRNPRGARKLEISSDVAPLSENFRWLAGINADGSLAPVFFSRGRKPTTELPAFDPWEKRPIDVVNPLDQRLYYLDEKGPHTIPAPEGYRFAGWLHPSREELAQGTVRLVLSKGSDYVLEYFTAALQGTRVGAMQKLDFSIYQRLTGLRSLPMLSLGSASGQAGSVFVEEGTAGRMRLSVKPLAGARSNTLLPWVIEPTKAGDILSEAIAAFGSADAAGLESAGVFARSRFQLYFHDYRSGITLGTDLKQYDSVTRHLAAWVGGAPAMVLPEGQGSSLTTEAIVAKGGALYRPASLQTLGVEGCEQVQLKATGAAGAGSGMIEALDRMTYFCGDHFVEIAF